jgi:hypothetical protein
VTITNGLITLADYEAFTTQAVDAKNVGNAEGAIETASRWCEQYTAREFHSTASSDRYFDARDRRTVIVGDCASITAVASDMGQDGSYTNAHTDYQTLPVGGYSTILGAVPISAIRLTTTLFPIPIRRQGLVKVTATWGWASVPMPVKRACATLALDIVKDPTAAFGAVTGDFGVLRIKSNPRTVELLHPYRRFELVGGFA